jgi:hypothetical protein
MSIPPFSQYNNARADLFLPDDTKGIVKVSEMQYILQKSESYDFEFDHCQIGFREFDKN